MSRIDTIEELDVLLREKVWPNVIAVGLLSEFYNQLLLKDCKNNYLEVSSYLSNSIARKDWFFKSISDQSLVNNNQMTFDEFIVHYGIRSDKDYELTSPRWEEIKDVIKKRIENCSITTLEAKEMPQVKKKTEELINTSIKLQLMRSEAKRKTLVHIKELRKAILKKTNGISEIENLSKEDVLKGKFENMEPKNTLVQNLTSEVVVLSGGKGISVSQGKVKGIIKNIFDNDTEILSGTIGVFLNASPEYAIQYPKCSGMIFLRGGQTSHGSIVAREFGIPAIIDNKAQGIEDGTAVEINGSTGEWKII